MTTTKRHGGQCLGGGRSNVDSDEARDRVTVVRALRAAVLALVGARADAARILGAEDAKELERGFFEPDGRGRK